MLFIFLIFFCCGAGDFFENRVKIFYIIEAAHSSNFVMGTKGDRAKRTHRLCEKGGAIESVCPETKDMTSAAFYQLAEFIFDLPEVKKYLERFEL